MFYKDERLAVLIDGPHLMSAAGSLGMHIDYKLLRDEFAKRGRLQRISLYHPVRENNELIPIRPLLDWLQYNGFDVVTKPIREFTEENGVTRKKGNLDVEMAVDALMLSQKVDHIVLFSGSGDLCHLVQNLRMQVSAYLLFRRYVGHPQWCLIISGDWQTTLSNSQASRRGSANLTL